ncbi:DNA-binding protein [Cytobacillus firmus]|uniref:DNA-binding protein n=1 Tax=Cytobacillus firmus TaxID=1399 RepID=A0A800MS59_CYTFI|nr:DNA-binding protein [Cytobacillus firmus]KAF0821508.1 hypothetical protein KIS1582_4751 [Cytobacillus firmus]
MKYLNGYTDTLTPRQIKDILGIGLRQTYQLLKTKPFTEMRVGKGNLYSKRFLLLWLEGKD